MNTHSKLILGTTIATLVAAGVAVAILAWPSSPSSTDRAVPVATLEAPRPTELATVRPMVTPVSTRLTNENSGALEASPEPLPEEMPEGLPEPELVTDGSVRVRRLVVASGVRRHEPIGAADAFEVGAQSRLYAFVDAANETGEPVNLQVTFEPERGESVGHVALEVPAGVRRWRTWAYTRHIDRAGRWRAVVRGPDGRVVASRAFDVVN